MKYITPEEVRAKRGNIKYLDSLRELARENRKNPTRAELLVWNILLRKKGFKYLFLRQKPIGRFILDFYCSKLLLAIEIDGNSHDGNENYDEGRDLYLEQRGIKTVRLRNEDVVNKIEKVKIDLEAQIKERELVLKSPFPQREI